MAVNAQAECCGCHQILTKNLMHEVNGRVATGRSGSSLGFFSGTRRNAKGNESGSFSGSRLNTGRTYYAYRAFWYCDACFQARRRRRTRHALGTVAALVLGLLAIIGITNDNSGSGGAVNTPTLTAANSNIPANAETPTSAAQAVVLGTEAEGGSAVALPSATQPANLGADVATGAPIALSAASTLSTPAKTPSALAGNRVVGLSSPASVRSQVPPRYPLDAMRAQEHGEVIIDASITATGMVQSATVERSSGYRALDDAAKLSVLQWAFNPAERNGQPVATTVRIPINFATPSQD